ncbi:ORF2 similar to XcGV ORF2 [Cydia pomonella granulovirus]|uniref:ORF2 n=2 Tax=Cydia pomonella granulosis virus TaxID=28289 RepID=A0A097P1B0_GVCP|nr:ORF2 similar to XcGV ORF2 [Cydia pomonella granulovirus]AAK70669.1 ORF2 similar to XcGV ORF2 [Cydia pomonella granulovirus]AIU36928.1 ORF2 [Cydia pomonella granulovirus]AIU37070.1 ORF2 [Cydia pomonella granulovirus]AIU37212.1 ORF2 [Cydia pomonella granulovirus]QDW81063.1 ORF2 [Cydia pomonella granulovirus]
MDLLGFMRRAGFKADVRDLIKRMKRNTSLKEKLASKFGDGDTAVLMTIEEVTELLESVVVMMHRISVGRIIDVNTVISADTNTVTTNTATSNTTPVAETLRVHDNNINLTMVCGGGGEIIRTGDEEDKDIKSGGYGVDDNDEENNLVTNVDGNSKRIAEQFVDDDDYFDKLSVH